VTDIAYLLSVTTWLLARRHKLRRLVDDGLAE
jgi:hypothetical protein